MNVWKQPTEVFYKKGVLKNFTIFTGKHLCQSLFFKKETLAHVFSCEFCEIFKNSFLYRTPLVTASKRTYFHASVQYLQGLIEDHAGRRYQKNTLVNHMEVTKDQYDGKY